MINDVFNNLLVIMSMSALNLHDTCLLVESVGQCTFSPAVSVFSTVAEKAFQPPETNLNILQSGVGQVGLCSYSFR